MPLPQLTPDTPTPDGELLRRFVADRDEAAFELLVWRHSRLVFEVCRRVLRHRQDAEDAAQAAFLVFARRADTVRTAVAGWLAQVAYRCALRIAQQAATARKHLDDPLPRGRGSSDDRGACDFDLDAELNRLPDRYRLPLVLCCLQGLSYDEAAAQLNVKPGTLSGRLSRAKALLRERLLARGVVVPAVAACLAGPPRGSALTPESVRSIVTAAFAPTECPGRVAAVAHGVTRMLTLHTFARRSLAVVALAAVVLFAGRYAATLLADEPKKPAQADPPKVAAKTDQERVQGEWVFDSAEAIGGTNGIDQAWHSLVTFDGDKLTVTKYQGFDWSTAFKLDATASPKQFDMTVNELAKKVMGFKDGTLKGIYRFDDDALEICLPATPDDPRPKEFATGPKLKQFRFTLKKKAKDFDPAKLTEFKLTVIDGDGKPVEGAVVCQYFAVSTQETNIVREKGKNYTAVETSTMTAPPLPPTNKDGETTYDTAAAKNDGFRPNGVLYVRHEKRKLVALEPISPARVMNGVTVVLRPEAKLTGKVVCPKGVDAGPTTVHLRAHNVRWTLAYTSHESAFEFTVPVGEYKLNALGEYITPVEDADVAVGLAGTNFKLEATPTAFGSLRGHTMPALTDMAEWKGKEVKPADLKGKVVLLKFFTTGENTDIIYSMPRLIDLHTEYADKGLVVVGVHVPLAEKAPVVTVKQLDKKLDALRTNDWQKGDIPFPIGLLKPEDGVLGKVYGTSSPVLIDRDGKVVGLFSVDRKWEIDRLEKLLAEK